MNGGLKIIGVGMWRTGTYSLKLALEQLTGEPCLHMSDLMPRRPGMRAGRSAMQTEQWLRVVRGEQSAYWPRLLRGYGSVVDWPALMFWRELVDFYPDALVLLSERSAESWWQSISNTVLQIVPTLDATVSPWDKLIAELFVRDFIGTEPIREAAIDFYERHNAEVRAAVPPKRLIEWHITDGWPPLCRVLNMPIPTNPFPRTNTTAEFRRGHNLSK